MARDGSILLILALLLLSGCGGESSPGSRSGATAPGVGAFKPGATGFVDRTRFSGFTFKNHTGKESQKDYIVEAKGGGALVLDYDRDGDMDIYVVDGNSYAWGEDGQVILSRTTNPEAGNRLLRNDGGWRFTDVTGEAGVGDRSYGFGGGVGDYDNDGDPDIYVCNWGRNVLYRNDGDGTFTDVTDVAGVGGDDNYYSTCATFFDADGDGDLDLYVSNYNDISGHIRKTKGRSRRAKWRGIPVYDGPLGIDPWPDNFYRNNGDGTFTDETETALRKQKPRYAFTSVAADFDKDGDLDVYVANDVKPNTMWVNDGSGRFVDRADEADVALGGDMTEQAGMGNDAADYDQDGWQDIFVTNFGHDTNALYRNLTGEVGDLLFEEVTQRVGLGATEDFIKVCWGTKFQDFNHDGYLDLFVAAGHVYMEIDRFTELAGTTYRQLPSLWYNQGPPRWNFVHMNDAVGGEGVRIKKCGRALCVADFDDDGDMDLYLAALNDTPLLLENRLPKEGNWLMLDLVAGGGKRSAIGTVATVTAGGGRIVQMQEMRRSASFIGTNDPRLHWGVGKNDVIDRLEVTWFGGETQVFTKVEANHLYRLQEGGELERLR